MFKRHGFLSSVGLLLVGFISVFLSAQPVSAAGETYVLSASGSQVGISGGNVSSVVNSAELSGGKLYVNKVNDERYPSDQFQVFREDFNLKASAACDTAWIEVILRLDGKKVQSVLSGCGSYGAQETGTRYSGDDTWAYGETTSYTVESGGDTGGNNGGDGPTVPDTSGAETYTFTTPDGMSIRACGGMFNQFRDNCLNFTFSQAPGAGGPISEEFIYTASGNATFTPNVCTINFAIGIPTERVIQEDHMAAKINRIGVDVLDNDCYGTDWEATTKTLDGTVDSNKPIIIGGVGTLTSFIGGPVGTEVDDAERTSCAVDGIGWIVCPVMTFLGTISDSAYKFISDSFLKIDVGLVNTTLPSGAVNPTYSTWQTFRNIANILFVIVFLIIVFSQLTSAGISNYGVKKMLPRLVIAAILVNASYFIAQIAVDISNILGYGLKSLFETLPIYSTATTSGLEVVGQALTWAVILAGALTVLAGIVLAVSVPVLLAAALSVLMIVLILIGRQALIILLIILSPIAFVAWLLPNTEQYFKKWWKMFFTLLMVFPIVGVLFGASKLAATVLQVVGAGSSDELMQVIAMGVATIPLIMTPSILKSSLNAAGSIGTTLGKLSGNANKNMLKKARTDTRLGEALKNRQLTNIRNRAAKRTRTDGGRLRTWQSDLDKSKLGQRLGFGAGAARAAQITDAADQEEMKNMQGLWEREGRGGDFDWLESKVNDKGVGSVEGRAALAMLAAKGASTQVQRIRNGDEARGIKSQRGADFDRTIAPYFPALKAKDFRAVGLAGNHTGDKNLLAGVRASDMYTMTDDALEAGASADPTFAATLRAAARDPEQARYFSSRIRESALVTSPDRDEAHAVTPTPPPAGAGPGPAPTPPGGLGPTPAPQGGTEPVPMPDETVLDIPRPTLADLERNEAEEIARRTPPQNPS